MVENDLPSVAEVMAHAAGYAKALDDCDRADVAKLIKDRDVLTVDLAITRARLQFTERQLDELKALRATFSPTPHPTTTTRREEA